MLSNLQNYTSSKKQGWGWNLDDSKTLYSFHFNELPSLRIHDVSSLFLVPTDQFTKHIFRVCCLLHLIDSEIGPLRNQPRTAVLKVWFME